MLFVKLALISAFMTIFPQLFSTSTPAVEIPTTDYYTLLLLRPEQPTFGTVDVPFTPRPFGLFKDLSTNISIPLEPNGQAVEFPVILLSDLLRKSFVCIGPTRLSILAGFLSYPCTP